jgi:hypothetical protein
MSYGGSNRGGGCVKACAHFFSWMANWRDLKLCQIIYYSQNGRIHVFF